MTRNIQSINPFTKTLVYINFSNGTFGIRKFEDGKWTNVNLSDAELAAAKKLAVKDGKWTKWVAPRNTTPRSTASTSTNVWAEGPLTTERDEREVSAKMVATRTSEF